MRHGATLRPFISVVNSSPPMMEGQDKTQASPVGGSSAPRSMSEASWHKSNDGALDPPGEEKTRQLREACERIMSESKAVAHAVALHDYESGLCLSINSDRRFHAASTMKVAILLAIGRAFDEKRLEPEETLHVRNRFLSAVDGTPFRIDAESDGYPQLHRLVGRTAKVADLTEWMIVSSSNLATNLLLDYLTVDYVRGVLDAAGIKGMDLRRGVDDTKAHAQNFNNETTAQGLLDLFATLRGEFLSKASRERAINILLQQRFNSMIPAPLPAHASVAHKTGEISTACHDAGIVYLPERGPYILVVLTEVPAETNGRRETIAKVSQVVFQMLTGTEGNS
jgi:beta-lactamase class A